MSTVAQVQALAMDFAGPKVALNTTISPQVMRMFYDYTMQECVQAVGQIYQVFTGDITSGTAVVCTPSLDVIEAAYITDSSSRVSNPSKKYQLAIAHSHDFRGGQDYTDPESGRPEYLITEGLNRLRLSPVPDYTRTGALELHGYGVYDPASYALTAECPFKGQDETAVVLGMAYRILEYLGEARQVSVKQMYDKARAQLEINAHVYSAASRVRGVASGSNRSTLNPLNL
jgi:hypothetical protein